MDQACSPAPGTHLETSPCQTGQGRDTIYPPSCPQPVPSSPQGDGSVHLTKRLPKGQEENNGKFPPVPQVPQHPFPQTAHPGSVIQEVPRSTDDRIPLPPLFVPGAKWY